MRAFIFDCDGVLVDSEKLSCGALNTIFDQFFGIDIGTDYAPIIGKALNDSISYYLEKYNCKGDLSSLMEAKEGAYRSSAKGKLKTFPGAVELLTDLVNKGIPIAVASSGSLEKIQFSLNEVGLTHFFKIIASSEEVQRGKPNPDVFILAADRLGVPPEHCVVIEDSLNGAKGALDAGMKVYGFPGAFSEDDFHNLGASYLPNGFFTLIALLQD